MCETAGNVTEQCRTHPPQRPILLLCNLSVTDLNGMPCISGEINLHSCQSCFRHQHLRVCTYVYVTFVCFVGSFLPHMYIKLIRISSGTS